MKQAIFKNTVTGIIAAISVLSGILGFGKALAAEGEGLQFALEFLKGIDLSGFVSTSANYNFNEPSTRTNDLRIFDQNANTFNLDIFKVVLEKEAQEGGIGFRADLVYGDVAEGIGSTGLGTTDDEFDVEQAYINLNEPFKQIEGLNLTAGKFATLLGGEVIESVDNYNTSRSFLFGYAIPFTHTGILADYTYSEILSFKFGGVNGWDNVKDNNDAKTILGAIYIDAVDWFSIGVSGVYGAEQDDDNGSQRGVVDVVATLTPVDKLTLVANLDYGEEEDALSPGVDAEWSGIAGYAHYQLTDRWGIAARGEFFDDNDGARTGTAQELWEVTATNDYKVTDNFLVRLEYRHDESDQNSFTKDDGSVTDTQDTISTELIYTF